MELSNAVGEYLRKTSLEQRRSCDHATAFDADIAEVLVKLMAPIAPHWADELWTTVLGHEGSVHVEPWPTFDPEQAKADEIELAVQVNGKVRAKFMERPDLSNDELYELALAQENIQKQLEGKTIRKHFVIKGKMVNIVAN